MERGGEVMEPTSESTNIVSLKWNASGSSGSSISLSSGSSISSSSVSSFSSLSQPFGAGLGALVGGREGEVSGVKSISSSELELDSELG